MPKREVDSREEDERKRQKCDITDEEEYEEVYGLWPMALLEEALDEEEKEASAYLGLPGQFSDDGSLLKSSQGSSSSSDSAKSLCVPPTRDAFLKFLRTVPTSKWNSKENAWRVFKHFGVRPYIVHPEHLLSKFYDSDYKWSRIRYILKDLEEERMPRYGLPWSKLEKSIEEFIVVYECEGLEELADIHGDRKQEARALELLNAFKTRLEKENKTKCGLYAGLLSTVHDMTLKTGTLETGTLETGTLETGTLETGTLETGTLETGTLETGTLETRKNEELFGNYVRYLINFIEGRLSIYERKKKPLQFLFPDCKAFNEFKQEVIPDILVASKMGKGSRIVLVGEIKTVDSHGRRFESHKDRKLKGAYKSSDKRDGEKVEPVASTSIADGEKTLVEDEEPDHADAVTEKKEDIIRYLDKAEKYKVSGFLPQLLAQMMAAMQLNPLGTIQHTSYKENYQIGFVVEGWKLRFVKLVVRDYLNRFNGPQQYALVFELLKGKPFKCDVYITQEFNLLKGRHVKMFFKMLVAIGHNNARITI